MSFDPNPTVIEGSTSKALTTDNRMHELLASILVELRILNLHQSETTDNEFVEADINIT